jgi:hypothetical protein
MGAMTMRCQSCGAQAPTYRVFFVQHIGAILFFFHKRISGNLCRSCVDKYFSEYFLTTLFLGWWGAISLFATPVVLVIDLVNYIPAVAALRSPRRKQQPPTPAVREATPRMSLWARLMRVEPAMPVCPAPTCRKQLRLPPDARGALKCRYCDNVFVWK